MFGHKPQPAVVFEGRTVNLDTGCVFASESGRFFGLGNLSALVYPQMEVVSELNID